MNRCIPELFLKKVSDQFVKDNANHTVTIDGKNVEVDLVKNATGYAFMIFFINKDYYFSYE